MRSREIPRPGLVHTVTMNDNFKRLRPRGYDEFVSDLCEAILDRVTELRLTSHSISAMGIRARRDDIMRLRDRELHRYWSFHKIARLAEALGIRVELSFRFDDEIKKAA